MNKKILLSFLVIITLIATVNADTENLYATDLTPLTTSISSESNAYGAFDSTEAYVTPGADWNNNLGVDATIDNHQATGTFSSLEYSVKLRFPGTGFNNDYFKIQYSTNAGGSWTDSDTFQTVSSLTTFGPYSTNAADWTDVDDFKVRIVYVKTGGADKPIPKNLYIDGYQIDVDYSIVSGRSVEGITVAQVDSGYVLEAGRNIDRDSSGIWYILYHNGSSGYLHLAVSDDTTPTGFTSTKLTGTGGIINSSHNSDYGTIYIDGNDVAHIIYVADGIDEVTYSQCDTSTGCDDASDWTHADGTTQGSETIGSDNNCNDPQLAVHSDGEISTVWAGDEGIKYRRYNGADWETEESIDTNDWSVRPNLDIDSNDNVHLVYRQTYGPSVVPFEVAYTFRKASTETWRNCADDAAGPELVYDASSSNNKYPSIAIDGNDDIWVSFNDDSNVLQYNKCTIGSGWGSNSQLDTTSDRQGQLGIMPNGKPIVVFERSTGDDIMYAKWTGTDWNSSVAIDTTGTNGVPRIERTTSFGKIGLVYVDSDSPHILYFNSVNVSGTAPEDTTAPTVSLTNPADEYTDNDGNVTFEYTPNDVASGITSCELIINGSVDQTDYTITEGSTNSFSKTGMTNGTYTWNVNCTDDSANANEGSGTERTLYIAILPPDTTAPTVTLNSPADYYNDTDGDVTFNYTPNDVDSGIASCELIIDGSVDQTDYTITEGSQNTFTKTGMSDGTYTWNVNCTDDSANANEGSGTERTLYVSIPSVQCWDASYTYLVKNNDQANKFCKCAEGTYDYLDYTAYNTKVTVYYYTDVGDNTNWEINTMGNSKYINSVQCTDSSWYDTNLDYYYS